MADPNLTALLKLKQVQDTTPFTNYIFTRLCPIFAGRLDPVQLPSLIKEGMELMETFKNTLTGEQRKRVLIDVMKRIVEGTAMDPEKKKWCLVYLDTGASMTIDVIAMVAKGMTNINKECCRKFWCCCC